VSFVLVGSQLKQQQLLLFFFCFSNFGGACVIGGVLLGG